MTVQLRNDLQVKAFELAGDKRAIDDAVVAQDAVRSGALVQHTLMSLDPATNKWVPFDSAVAVDGTEFPRGILNHIIPEADIQAGDVEDVNITVGNLVFNENQLTIEGGLTLETIITTAACSVRSWLRQLQLYAEAADYVDRGENA